MTEREILRKVIDKAVKNGYKDKEISKNFFSGILNHILELLEGKRNGLINANRYYALIFDIGFAKALWGETTQWTSLSDGVAIETISSLPPSREEWDEYIPFDGWQHHLQQMALYENPLDYLKKFLENGREEIKETEIDRINRIARTPFDERDGNKNRNICSNCGGSGDYHNLNCGLK